MVGSKKEIYEFIRHSNNNNLLAISRLIDGNAVLFTVFFFAVGIVSVEGQKFSIFNELANFPVNNYYCCSNRKGGEPATSTHH
jgi:hypothetical protein